MEFSGRESLSRKRLLIIAGHGTLSDITLLYLSSWFRSYDDSEYQTSFRYCSFYIAESFYITADFSIVRELDGVIVCGICGKQSRW